MDLISHSTHDNSKMSWIVFVVLITFGKVYCDEKIVCPMDGEQIRCNLNQVAIINSAAYGEIADRSLCGISSARDSCTTDVFRDVDKWCTGLQYCFLDEGFVYHLQSSGSVGNNHDCLPRGPRYLVVDYTCVDVAMPSVPHCTKNNRSPTTLSGPEGYIASRVTHNTECGQANSPWVIRVPKGYRVELDIVDLNTHRNQPVHYGRIIERNVDLRTTFGSGLTRDRPLYRSQSNEVVIQLEYNDYNPNPARFILHYRAFISIDDRIRYLAMSSGSHSQSNASIICITTCLALICMIDLGWKYIINLR